MAWSSRPSPVATGRPVVSWRETFGGPPRFVGMGIHHSTMHGSPGRVAGPGNPPDPLLSPVTPLPIAPGGRPRPTVGRPDGFEAFYRDHAADLRRALCLALGDADLGRDAADEALARACARWSDVR